MCSGWEHVIRDHQHCCMKPKFCTAASAARMIAALYYSQHKTCSIKLVIFSPLMVSLVSTFSYIYFIKLPTFVAKENKSFGNLPLIVSKIRFSRHFNCEINSTMWPCDLLTYFYHVTCSVWSTLICIRRLAFHEN